VRIDAHIHLLPDEYRSEVMRRAVVPFALPPWSLELTEELMARHDIGAAILSLSPPGVWFGDAGLAADLARMVNERTAAVVRSDRSRFAGLAVLPLPDLDGAMAELSHALDVLGLDGVALLSNVEGIYHGDPAWAPLWDELDRRGAYVFIHPTAPPHALPLPDHPIWLYEFTFDTTRTVANLIYSGTLERCRKARIQVAHLGGTAPFLAHRIASLAAREPERAALAPGGALAALARLYYDTGLSNNRLAVETTLQVAPVGQIVFGTDWPYAALPASGDPSPEFEELAVDRSLIDSQNAGALVPRFVSRP
jgi:6-methylsalicylate decarboxylase